MSTQTPDSSETRNDLHDVLEIQHIAQGRGQRREEYEPVILDELENIIETAVQQASKALLERLKTNYKGYYPIGSNNPYARQNCVPEAYINAELANLEHQQAGKDKNEA